MSDSKWRCMVGKGEVASRYSELPGLTGNMHANMEITMPPPPTMPTSVGKVHKVT